MKPSIRIYGGVHDDPGSRQRFLEELRKRRTPPHCVAVEWEQSVFERLEAWRPWIEEELRSCWDFLTREDCYELSLALAWEGDASTHQFPDVDRLWLETGHQEAYLQRCRREQSDDEFLKGLASVLLEHLRNPCRVTTREAFANVAPPPEPRSTQELVRLVSSWKWSEACERLEDFKRDPGWAAAISDRCYSLRQGWIAVICGWAHADPAGDNQRLRGLLLAMGFRVTSVCLAPKTPARERR